MAFEKEHALEKKWTSNLCFEQVKDIMDGALFRDDEFFSMRDKLDFIALQWLALAFPVYDRYERRSLRE